MCEDCKEKYPKFGLPSEGKTRRWCSGCAKAHGVDVVTKTPGHGSSRVITPGGTHPGHSPGALVNIGLSENVRIEFEDWKTVCIQSKLYAENWRQLSIEPLRYSRSIFSYLS